MDYPLEPKKRKKKAWKLTFDPMQLERDHDEINMAQFKLSEKELKRQAVICSSLRETIRTKALEYESASATSSDKVNPSIPKLAKRVEMGHFSTSKKRSRKRGELPDEPTPVGLRKRCRKKGPLTTKDKLDITFRVIKNKESQMSLAREYRVTDARIS